jgi:hypothetical protein
MGPLKRGFSRLITSSRYFFRQSKYLFNPCILCSLKVISREAKDEKEAILGHRWAKIPNTWTKRIDG